MNSCVLMAEIIKEPELRYKADNQLEITEMLVQFPGQRENDPPANLKVVGFGNLAKEIQQNYHEGDRVILIGRLSMNTIERPEGFKEKRAEMTVQQIHHLDSANENSFMQSPATQAIPVATTQTPSVNTPPPVAATTPKRNTVNAVPAQNAPQPEPVSQATSYEPSTYPAMVEEDIPEDDIPF
ncbi:single-stranded DNA-binding protein [Rivularia sp. PCC 7116]|uniref:single-stranded DNA-binding protein n=1 Tax=Rivularia sp. PCC 7116 TaxID=373994 RepID=UPI00029ED171|nr:single-stranded DNA-binding protein [Rivularia sp. PCC 7116]AFY54888.1 single-stranded DNA-binding protein [Rivularia sp. PCC 7116]